jgi:hypothetical protein
MDLKSIKGYENKFNETEKHIIENMQKLQKMRLLIYQQKNLKENYDN